MFKSSKIPVLVVGDVMLDEIWVTSVDRVSPEAPVPIGLITNRVATLGGAANVALNCSNLFDQVSLIGVVGNDLNGLRVRELCSESNIDFRHITSESVQTTNKTRIVGNGQQIVRLDDEAVCSLGDAESVVDLVISVSHEFGLVIFSDYDKGSLYHCQKMIEHCVRQGIPTMVDPKSADFSRYMGCDFIKPNLKEFNATCKFEGLDYEEAQMATDILSKFSIKNLIVTKSSEGISHYGDNSEQNHFSATALDVFDVTGAGDTVLAALGFALTNGVGIKEALRVASLAAGYVVGVKGTAGITLDVMNTIDGNFMPKELKILSFDELLEVRNVATARNKSLVMTNGCFDILHPGHLHYLKECSLRGDILVVLLNSDSSIAKLKGPKRPINSECFRATMLSYLDFVDYIYIFNDVTPVQVYASVTPDVLVKGGDYIATELVGYHEVNASGGTVEIVDLVDGFSTTKSLNRILERYQ